MRPKYSMTSRSFHLSFYSIIKTLFLCAFFLLSLPNLVWAVEKELVVYSARNEQLIKPIFDGYTKKTGITIRFITDKAGPLLQRLRAEGPHTPADLLITVDAGNLWQASQMGHLQAIHSDILESHIPKHLRDPKNRWFGLSVRARTIVYNTQKVKPEELSTYENLGDPQWKNRLCLRTSKKVYNQSLIAMMIRALGIQTTEQIVRSWVQNLATDVYSNDTQVMKAIAAGQCDVGIINSYYYGRLMNKEPSLPLALFWPNQKSRGVHINISGAGVVKYSKHQKEATQLLEWLSSKEAQNLFADANLEYPANPSVLPHPKVTAWGSFKQDRINISKAGELQSEAVKLMDRAGYK